MTAQTKRRPPKQAAKLASGKKAPTAESIAAIGHQELARDIQQVKNEFSGKIDALQTEVRSLRTQVAETNAEIAETNASIKDLLEAWRAANTVVAAMKWAGRVMKWAAYVGGFVLAVWATIKGVKSSP